MATLFDLSGGALCLDFVNGLEGWEATPASRRHERFPALADLAAQSGVLDEKARRALRRRARERPRDAARVVSRAVALREALLGVFAAVAAGEGVPGDGVGLLNGELGRALGNLRVLPGEEGFDWSWPAETRNLDRVLWPVLWSAAGLLTSDDRTRIRECALESCRWLFLDRSRNRSRRWCDMKVCGNRDKVRRHYLRSREER